MSKKRTFLAPLAVSLAALLGAPAPAATTNEKPSTEQARSTENKAVPDPNISDLVLTPPTHSGIESAQHYSHSSHASHYSHSSHSSHYSSYRPY